ncbi:valine--tRNA ligase [Planctomyces sp. SH-PL14]|uniref:valine--tRNA ligase n=1 Tax=Planctomyces sp. SH-PL14 TaxID=1632864 RepID=UPI00078EC945|nr:valine--tRNA ligase [Planctomyces sp. SH-PL14]AMV19358.1 Valine--tRNA ligase [Planctomyces sp. SH-PL14]
MSTELPKQYDPQSAQTRWFAFWEKNGYFNADPGTGKPSHTIMIPLPNVTGALHMGHALNGTVQDLITRWRRMQGYEALWMPGTDHAGIATQSIVEKRMLEEEGKTRHDIGREALVDRIWKWKDVYEARILSQQKQLGASCDWRRVRFTLDEVCSRAVRRTFFKMFQDGLIYRGKRLVNWDAFLQTAVADDEVYDEEIDGHFWTFNYPVVDADGKPTGEAISFSTTRPETMLGDTAVCVHPTDERYTALVGKQVQIPVNGRLIPVIADGLLADKELGTGCVKVTPAHDPNDYACFMRNPEIGIINILNPNGTVNENGGQWQGLDRYDARKAVVAEMERLGHFEKVEDRKIPMKHSDRSKTPIEPYLSEQWFVKMGDHDDGQPGLAQMAMEVVEKGRVKFFPSRYAKTYLDWLGEKRDWCISRQLWWGHRIPIWTIAYDFGEGTGFTDRNDAENAVLSHLPTLSAKHIEISMPEGSGWLGLPAEFDSRVRAYLVRESSFSKLIVCVADGELDYEKELEESQFIQDPDVLDTWFSSALWPHATLGWPDLQHDPPLDPKEVAKQTIEGLTAANPAATGQPKVAANFDPTKKPFASFVDLIHQPIDLTAAALVPAALAHELQVVPLGHEEGRLVIAAATGVSAADDVITARLQQDYVPTEASAEGIAFALSRLYPDYAAPSLPSAFSLQASAQNEVLKTFYPGSVLVTSRDIITLWVARMVLTGLYNMGDIPFKHVCVHPKILDGFGQGMSKSKGNGVDPLELIDRYGCDGTRFTIASFAGETQDVRLPVSYECPHCQAAIPQLQEHLKFKPGKPKVKCPKCKKEAQYAQPWYTPDEGVPVARITIERFEYGRNFCNKLWNAARFAIMNLEGYTPALVAPEQFQLEDRWILSRLASVAKEMDEYLSRYQLDAATRAIREFTWNEFCDWYLEMIKPRLRKAEGETQNETRAVAQRVLLTVLDSLVRLLQPFTPFLCEELWHRLNEIAPTRSLPTADGAGLAPRAGEEAAIVAQWPPFPATWRDEALERRFSRLQETIIAVRNVRAVYNIPPSTQLQLMIRASNDVAGDMQNVASQFDNLAKSVLAAAGADVVRPPASASFSLGDADGFVPLEGIIDRKSELERQQKEAEKLRKLIAGSEAKLNNESFVSKAPAHIVDGIKETLAGLQKQLASAEEIIRDLS